MSDADDEIVQLRQARDELQREHDKTQAALSKLQYQTRMMGVALPDQPDRYGSRIEGYTLSHCLDLMDAWRPDVERWGLHQMCRVLREELATRLTEDEARGLIETLDDLRRTFDLRWKADQRAIKRWQEAHPGNDLVWPDRADMVVWLLGRLDVIDEARDVIHGFQAAHERALAAIPCTRGKDDCAGNDYPYAPCCNLRVALLPGEAFPTDHLAESGYIHLFEPTDPAKPRAPRASAGCVKLVEATPLGWLDAIIEHDGAGERVPDSIIRAGDGQLTPSELDERFSFKHQYLG